MVHVPLKKTVNIQLKAIGLKIAKIAKYRNLRGITVLRTRAGNRGIWINAAAAAVKTRTGSSRLRARRPPFHVSRLS